MKVIYVLGCVSLVHGPSHSGVSLRCSYSGKIVVLSVQVNSPTEPRDTRASKTSGGEFRIMWTITSAP